MDGHSNMSREEQETLRNLRSYDDIISEPADKRSAVVILDSDKYVAEAVRQLSDEEIYIPFANDPT